MSPPTPLTELAASVRRLERLRGECPERLRPTQTILFHNVERVRRDVAALTANGRPGEAASVVADFEREARALLAAPKGVA